MRSTLGLLLGIALAGGAVPAWAEDLRLLCDGTQTVHQVKGIRGVIGGDVVALNSGVSTDVQPRQLRVEISGTKGRLQWTDGLIWRPILDLEVGDTEIRGRYRVTAMNKPTVKIDRTTGAVAIHTSGGIYAGTCAPDLRDPEERKF